MDVAQCALGQMYVLVILRADRYAILFKKSTVVTANAMQGYINFKFLRTNVCKRNSFDFFYLDFLSQSKKVFTPIAKMDTVWSKKINLESWHLSQVWPARIAWMNECKSFLKRKSPCRKTGFEFRNVTLDFSGPWTPDQPMTFVFIL